MVISNTITQDRKCLHASNPLIIDVTFTRVSVTSNLTFHVIKHIVSFNVQTPELVVGMFPTRYHYFNTVHRGQPEILLLQTFFLPLALISLHMWKMEAQMW